MADQLTSETLLASAALALGAAKVAGFTTAEAALADKAAPISPKLVRRLRGEISDGSDPLGDAFAALRGPEVRRESGATYTPRGIVDAMLSWAAEGAAPDRVVDPGTGSARFLASAGRTFKRAQLVGLELDPLAALLARANLSALGYEKRARIDLADYRCTARPFNGRTLFIGNPPYVRHHQIAADWKRWLVEAAAKYKLKASQLAGLHVYFYLATVRHASPGDRGALITAAEWLDVNYGQLVRELFLGPLGGQGIVVVEPTAAPFPDAATTAAITTFQIGARPTAVRIRRVKHMKDLQDLGGGRPVRRERLVAEGRWSRLTHASRACPEGFVELGEVCRVHRGTVTGANAVFIANSDAQDVPARFKLPTITKARELIAAGRVLADASVLRCVVDLPDELDTSGGEERVGVAAFSRRRSQGVHTKGMWPGTVALGGRWACALPRLFWPPTWHDAHRRLCATWPRRAISTSRMACIPEIS